MRRHGLVVAALAMLALAGLGLVGRAVLRHLARTSAPTARLLGAPIPVQVARATRAHLRPVIGATGTLAPSAHLSLRARVPARIERIAVEPGDQVAEGQELIVFETALARAALATAAEELRRARGDLDRATEQASRVATAFHSGLLPVTEHSRAQGEVAGARLRVESARESIAAAELRQRDSTLTAPFAAVVTERLANPGETPGNGAELLTLGRIDPLLMVAAVGEEHLAGLRLEQPAELSLAAFPGEVFRGQVQRIRPVGDPATRSFSVEIRLANGDRRLLPGLSASARIEREPAAAIAVPSVALIRPAGPDRSQVFVVGSDGRARLKAVRTGAIAEGLTAVLEGLADGESVVTIGQLSLRDGDRVRVGDELGGTPIRPGGEDRAGPAPTPR